MVDNSPESQELIDMDASASPPRLPAVVPSNQEPTVCIPASTSRPSSSNHQIMSQLESHPSSSSCLPSSSTAIPTRWKYDVFLSFRGPDTRKGITVDIRDRLQSRGIKTFMDDPDLQVGDTISPTLITAIQESRFAVVVFSQNYASSTWCLEELAKIWECMANQDRIFPLFYGVDPTDVRYQKKRSFKEAFSKHETSGRHKPEMVKQWRAALQGVANISGWNTDAFKTHRELVDNIVESLRSKVPSNAIESTDDFHAYEATTKAMDEVKEALRDDEITAVGVYGMGGVGKTTTVRHVAAQACRNGTFNHWIIATVSQDPNFKQIQGTLADKLGFKFEEESEDGRADRLHMEIMIREKLLIILDDVWENIELSKIGIPSFEELKTVDSKSKLLLTTRISNVCHVMKCQRRITLNILSKEDSWALFERKARRSFESPIFEGVAKKVAGECRGLPIALITVARALGDKDLVEWERAAERLKKSQTANPDHKGEAFECIRLSYDYLKDEEYKSYFLLCCLFPEDYEIEIEGLFRYAIGKGLFQDAETLKEARGRAESLSRHLQHSCLLLDYGKEGYVRMHDVVRDAAIQIAQSEHGFLVKAGCGLEDWPRQLHKDCSAISLMGNHISKLPENLVCSKLQILLLNRNSSLKEIPETFFQSPNELRVFDLSWTRISLLPQSFSLLTNLQALYLDECKHLTIDTSILGKLKMLEILSMRYSDVTELSIELGGLTNLRIFDNKGGGEIERIPPKVISQWHNLEELYIKGFWKWGGKVGEEGEETNAGFDEVTSLSKLRFLEARIFDANCIPKDVDVIPNWVELDIEIGFFDKGDFGQPSVTVCSISLHLDKLSRLPEWFRNEIMKRADMLWWKGCGSLIDIVVENDHGRLQGLKSLQISMGGERSTEVNPTITWVPKTPVLEILEELILDELDWAEFCEIVEFLPAGSLFNLKVLEASIIDNWWNILLSSTILQKLPNLEELTITPQSLYEGYESMDESYVNSNYSKEGRYVFGCDALHVLQPLKLKKIFLSGCDTVGICEGLAPPTLFQNLQTLFIISCNLEGSLFTYDVAQCLPQLNSLELRNCPLLERIVETSSKKTILPKLKQLTLIDLPMLCYESATFDIECPYLEYFLVEDCPKFSASSSDFHSTKQVKLGRWFWF